MNHDGLVVGVHDNFAVGVALGLVVVVGGIEFGAVGGEVAGVFDGVELERQRFLAGADEGVLKAKGEDGLEDARTWGRVGGT